MFLIHGDVAAVVAVCVRVEKGARNVDEIIMMRKKAVSLTLSHQEDVRDRESSPCVFPFNHYFLRVLRVV